MNKRRTSSLGLIGFLSACLLLLSACSLLSGGQSDRLQGDWKAQTGDGSNSTIHFAKDKVTVNGEEFDYKQKSVKQKGGVTYYQIEQNGKNYSVIFPEKDDDQTAIMIEPDSAEDDLYGTMLYAMNKKKTPNYQEYAKKYLE
ncbi:glycosyltransferase [Streptococcus panodentis]|uniref:Glycosyltransferase n=1 Tax=Streptococcus panodentis TaxID=1581472 RepID=A0ABS5AZ32_9STRE|nr:MULTISPECIES: glycosyltransferase [Streptococcus]KXT85441.1 hypothetical protein STRDD11_00377 [Streptococcus sp. DD11]MBP2621847.1 glycosyltransferase [Streptococcus panodentis]